MTTPEINACARLNDSEGTLYVADCEKHGQATGRTIEMLDRADYFDGSLLRYQTHKAEWILRDYGLDDDSIDAILSPAHSELMRPMAERELEAWAVKAARQIEDEVNDGN